MTAYLSISLFTTQKLPHGVPATRKVNSLCKSELLFALKSSKPVEIVTKHLDLFSTLFSL